MSQDIQIRTTHMSQLSKSWIMLLICLQRRLSNCLKEQKVFLIIKSKRLSKNLFSAKLRNLLKKKALLFVFVNLQEDWTEISLPTKTLNSFQKIQFLSKNSEQCTPMVLRTQLQHFWLNLSNHRYTLSISWRKCIWKCCKTEKTT